MRALCVVWVVLLLGADYQQPNRFRYAELVSVHDGDTVWLDISLGDGTGESLINGTSCRLYGIQAQELKEPGGVEAREFLKGLLAANASPALVAELLGRDKYGRQLVRLWVNRTDVNQAMIDGGHAAAMRR